ncbi:MAG: TetR/AcrR family transcriptional regulator [Acidobacteriota bacterium]|nr:MAG: TetR/AcrR family transcriptional regulator [Acidobacteriota bacterium]
MPKISKAHAEARRKQILEAACRCFSRKGVHRTTVRDICEEAGLSAGAVYGYFKSKPQIIEAMAELGRRNTRGFLESVQIADEPLQSLAQMLAAAMKYLNSKEARESTRLDVRFWGEGLHEPRIRDLFQQAFTNLTEPFADMVRAAQQKGQIAAHVDPEAAARVFAALGLGFTVQKALDPDADLSSWSQVIASLLNGSFSVERNEA